MEIELRSSEPELLREELRAVGLGDRIRTNRGGEEALFLSLAATVHGIAMFGRNLGELGQALSSFLGKRDNTHVILKQGTLELDITSNNLEKSLSTLKRHKLIP
jgi:hypothetical protein